MPFEPVLHLRRVTMRPLTLVKKSPLILVSLRTCQVQVLPQLNTSILVVGRTLVISWLPVTERARSTIIGRWEVRSRARGVRFALVRLSRIRGDLPIGDLNPCDDAFPSRAQELRERPSAFTPQKGGLR